MAERSSEDRMARGGRRARAVAAVVAVALMVAWFAWRGLGGVDDPDSFEAVQRRQAERCFGGLVPVELGDAAAVERWLSEPECIDCEWLGSEDRRRIMTIAREFLSRRFGGSVEEYAAWRDGLPGRRTTMREQIEDEALPHRHRYLLGRSLADDASFEGVFPAMFERGLTADGRPVGRIRLASGPGAVVLAAAEVRAPSPEPPRIDASTFGEVWIGSATLSDSSWWRPPAGGSFRELLASGSPFRCVQVGVVLEVGSYGRRAFRLRMVETPSDGWVLDAVGYAGLPGDPNFHLEY